MSTARGHAPTACLPAGAPAAERGPRGGSEVNAGANPAPAGSEALGAALLLAWGARFRRPETLLDHAQAVAARAPVGSSPSAWGALLAAMGLRAQGRSDDAGRALELARLAFQRRAEPLGGLVCLALDRLPLVAAGRGAEADAGLADIDPAWFEAPVPPLAAVAPGVAGPDACAVVPALRAYAGQFVFWARAMARNAAGQWDEALRDRYNSLHFARATGDPAAIAHALADLSSMQADLCNPEDALALATEAQAQAERAQAEDRAPCRSALDEGTQRHPASQAGDTASALDTRPHPLAPAPTLGWSMAAFNRLAAHLSLEQFDAAAALGRRLRPVIDTLGPRNRESACLHIGRALLQDGDLDGAEAMLERSERERVVGHLTPWTLLRVELHVARREGAAARQLCETFLAEIATQPPPAANPVGAAPPRHASGPHDLMLLHRAAAQACELLGDMASALRHARAEQRLLTQVLGQGAQARRLALEITHRLAQERAQREQAQQRERAAEEARQRLDALNRALAEANQAKTRFLAAASHDLRQPVQALAMNMAALQAEPLSTGQGLLVGRMAQSLDALGRMFDVLLDISRLDAGIVPVHAEPLALRPLLHRLLEEHRPAAEAKGLSLRLRLPAEAPALMSHSDPVLLERCLRNLLDNALKYTRHGGVLLAVRAVGSAVAAGMEGALHGQPSGWRVEIVDTGIGMTPEVQARVFEEFYQADNPERDRSRGLGLGGAIVLRLARLLGHGLSLRSRPGRGTRVSLQLPSRPEPVDVRSASVRPSDMPALCLAVVDDDTEVRDSLVAVLERWGHRALSGVDAEAVLRQWQGAGRPLVHGVLSDLRLRGQLDGRAVVATLRQVLEQPLLPALILTGDVAPERLQGLRDSGLPWLPKPVMPMRLRSWLAGVGAACPQGQ